MKSVLISIRHEWANRIFSLEKQMEVRKTKPKGEGPYCCYVYEPKAGGGIGLVVGEFVCRDVYDFSKWQNDYPSLLRHINLYAGTRGDFTFLSNYITEKKGFGWDVFYPLRYASPKPLSAFGLTRPPQSWCYVEERGERE